MMLTRAVFSEGDAARPTTASRPPGRACKTFEKLAGFLFVVATCAAAALVAAWLVRRFAPHASGSGIPHVESVLRGEVPPAPYILLPVKFAGGVLAIGSGMALGREGPSVQMGASIAHFIGTVCRRTWPDLR